MKVVIVAKTRMGGGACVGALTFEGRSLRLIPHDRETNSHFNMDYRIGDVWEIESRPDANIVPPHVENVIVTGSRYLGPMACPEDFIERHMPPYCGPAAGLFDGLVQQRNSGALFITESTGLPDRSTMFWQPDRRLTLEALQQKRLRYRYPGSNGGFTLAFTGFQEPLAEIPAGTLLRVSLAHWWRPPHKPDEELRCYVQLSGWYLQEPQSVAYSNSSPGIEKTSHPDHVPVLEDSLHSVFGYPEFRPLQRTVIENVLTKRDTLAVMPTGSGKSLCYQLPATLFPGLTVVVSPLIALMEDQVLELRELGIPAT